MKKDGTRLAEQESRGTSMAKERDMEGKASRCNKDGTRLFEGGALPADDIMCMCMCMYVMCMYAFEG